MDIKNNTIQVLDNAIVYQKTVKDNFDITLDIKECIELIIHQNIACELTKLNQMIETILEIARDA